MLEKNGDVLSAINLNYMFPVPKELIEAVEYSNIKNYRQFENKKKENLYIALLKKEYEQIVEKNIPKAAIKLYNLKNEFPENNISKRCFDFKLLEALALKY
ncbi:MAG: type III toxin-antitoxin system ToxN/AbiQ family toxin [Fusobacteriaceae bacterium]